MVANMVSPSELAFSSLIEISAPAPSLIVEALAAVTVPSLEKAARSAGILSILTFLNSSSSVIMRASPLR